MFRSEFHLKLRNREDCLRLVLVSEAGRVARSSFFRCSFTKACPGFWAIARLIETWGRRGIGRAYVPPGCTDVVKPILYRAAHRRGVPPAAGNFLDDSDVCCEKCKQRCFRKVVFLYLFRAMNVRAKAITIPGGLPYKKDGGCSSEVFKRTPKRYQDPVLWAWLERFFTL